MLSISVFSITKNMIRLFTFPFSNRNPVKHYMNNTQMQGKSVIYFRRNSSISRPDRVALRQHHEQESSTLFALHNETQYWANLSQRAHPFLLPACATTSSGNNLITKMHFLNAKCSVNITIKYIHTYWTFLLFKSDKVSRVHFTTLTRWNLYSYFILQTHWWISTYHMKQTDQHFFAEHHWHFQ